MPDKMSKFKKYLLDHGINFHYAWSGDVTFKHKGTKYFVGEYLDGESLTVFYTRASEDDVIADIFGDAE